MSKPSRDKDPLNSEIEAALDGVNLQEIGEPGGPGALDATGAKGGKGARGKPAAAPRLWKGTIAGISGKDVIVELGPRQQGVLPLSEFDDMPKVGQVFEFGAHGQEEGLWLLSRREARALAAWNEIERGAIAKARVTGQNTGGLECTIGPLKAFLPASQVGLGREEDLAQYIGQTLEVEVLEVDSGRKRVLVSRRAVLEKEREGARKEAVGSLAIGSVVQGKVTRIEAFGAFVDIGGGLEGMVHVSALSRKRVENPIDVVHVGQAVRAKVMKVEEGGKRIGLSMKELEADPWDDIGGRIAVGTTLAGKVVRLMEFGAFVELLPGVEGLLHVSQMGKERVRRPQDLFKPGQEVSVRVQAIDERQKRVSLSRLDERGAVIGSEDAVEGSVIEDVIEQNAGNKVGTNLGNLFKKALGGGK